MNKKLIAGLLLIVMCAIVFIFNARGSMELNLLFDKVEPITAVALLAFTSIGVIIGLLLK